MWCYKMCCVQIEKNSTTEQKGKKSSFQHQIILIEVNEEWTQAIRKFRTLCWLGCVLPEAIII